MFNWKLMLMLVALVPLVLTQNYCSKTLCHPNKKHVACNNNGAFQSSCGSNAKIIPITNELKNLILDGHNKYRNEVAKGLAHLQPAERMATMKWNPELAKLAELNVKQCVMKHDQCRNTNDFHYVGQNLATMAWMGMEKTIPSVIEGQIQMWFDEYKDTTMKYINSYSSPTNGKVIGHFTALAQDVSTDVGCAALKHLKSDGFTEQLLACNYARTNLLDTPVYKPGKAASKCTTGVNSSYKFLCSPKEKYDVNA